MSDVVSAPDGSPGGALADAKAIAGTIAARIDRLPLTRVQYLLAAITQLYWGILIDTDGMAARLYPFIWAPLGMTVFQFSIILCCNIGAGILIGEYLGSYLSDRFGRRNVLIASAFIDAVFLWPTAHTTNFMWLALWNLLYAIGMGFMLSTNAVYLHEIAPPGSRQRIAMRSQLVTALCALLPGILGITLIPDHYQWYIYALVLAQIVILLPLGLMLPESPRWLEAKGRHEEADRIVSKWEAQITRLRGPLPPPNPEEHTVIQVEKVPTSELFKGKYARRTVLILIVWFLGYQGTVYGGSSYLPTYLREHHWTAAQVFLWTTIVAAGVRVVAFFVASAMGERIERKNIILVAGVIWSATYTLFLVVSSFSGQIVLVLVAAPFGTLWLFNMYNYNTAAFPTRLRSVGTGWTDGIGHLGTFLGPLVIGPLYTATESHGHYGWLLYTAIGGGIVPSVLIYLFGMRQRGRVLEEMST